MAVAVRPPPLPASSSVWHGGSVDWFPGGVFGLIALGVAAYVACRVISARRRGDDTAGAAADALREVGPPALVLAAILTFVLSVLGILALIMFVALLNGDDSLSTQFVVVLYTMVFVAVLGTAGSIAWAIGRVRRRDQ